IPDVGILAFIRAEAEDGVEATYGRDFGMVALRKISVRRRRTAHLEGHNVAEGSVFESAGVIAIAGDQEKSAASLAHEIGQVFQVLFAKLPIPRIDVAQNDNIELVQLDHAGKTAYRALIFRGVFLVRIQKEDLQIDRLIVDF